MSFVGKYERVSAENYDEFLKALDVNFLLRKAATVSTPVMEVIIIFVFSFFELFNRKFWLSGLLVKIVFKV